ncbi:MAG: hypothetical protein KF868_07140 [Acidobacteria bacterium]|nr:hypothetical protein [Acidobacteriota bacterium]
MRCRLETPSLRRVMLRAMGGLRSALASSGLSYQGSVGRRGGGPVARL